MSTTLSDIKQDIEKLQNDIEILSALFAQEVDIHTHTRQIGPYYQSFNVIDQKYKLSSNRQSLEDVIKEILARCPSGYKKNISTVLDTIRATTRADDETHANLQELLIRTWSLVNMPNNYDNAFDILIKNLDHNIITGGGCVPGIAARLIQPYTHFVLRMLQVTCSQQVQTAKEQLKLPKPVMPIAETKVQQEEIYPEMIDPLTGKVLSPEQVRAQTAGFAQFEQITEAAKAAARAAREQRELQEALEAVKKFEALEKAQTAKEQPNTTVRVVFSNETPSPKNKPSASATSNAPAPDKKSEAEATRAREARLKRFGSGSKK